MTEGSSFPLPAGHASPPAARVRNLTKTYGAGETRVIALDDVTLDMAGEFTAVMGPSGSGKSTLMHCLAALDTADSGSVMVGDQELTVLKDKALTRLRRDEIGFVFQSYNLVPTLTAKENILLPLAIAGRRPDAGWYDSVIATVNLARPARPQAARALRGPAAAGGGGPGAGQPAQGRLRRRADRQPRLDLRRRGARAAAPQRRRPRPDRRDGHPRPGRGGVHRPGAVPRRRARRRRAARPRPASRCSTPWRASRRPSPSDA